MLPNQPPEMNPAPISTPETDDAAALRHQLESMQQRVQELEARLAAAAGSPKMPSRARWLLGLVWLPGLLLAALPPLLVVLDRWFKVDGLQHMPRDLWCTSDFLCHTAYRPYFIAIFICLLILLALIFFAAQPVTEDSQPGADFAAGAAPASPALSPAQVRLARALQAGASALYGLDIIRCVFSQTLPGAEVLLFVLVYCLGLLFSERSLSQFAPSQWPAALQSLRPFAAMAFGVLALSLLLRDLNNPQSTGWGLLLVALAAAVLIWIERQRIPAIFWVVCLAIVLASTRISSWRFSVIGDEFSFFSYAKDTIGHQRLDQIAQQIFNGRAVYSAHPYFSSLLQSLNMALFGYDNFGWRFANVLTYALALPLFYDFFRQFSSRRVALLTALLLACSSYLINFGKIGYNNLQALFFQALVLWAAARALNRPTPLRFTLLGMALAGCFYVYPAALYVVPLPLILLLVYLPFNRRTAMLWQWLAIGLTLLLIPLFFQPEYWLNKIAGTVFYSPELVENPNLGLFHTFSNVLYSLLDYLYIPEESHYVASSFLDPLTAIFVPIGLGLLLKQLRHNRFQLFCLLAFLVELLLVGVSHDRQFPPITRMFLLLPWWVFLAAQGISWCVETGMRVLRGRATPLTATFILLAAAIVAANLVQSTTVFSQRWAGIPNLETLFVRMVQHEHSFNPANNNTYLFLTTPDWGIDGLITLQSVYGQPESRAQLVRFATDQPKIPAEAVQRIQDENTLVIIQPWMDKSLRAPIEQALSLLGKSACDVRETAKTDVRFTVWYSSGLEGVCERANAEP